MFLNKEISSPTLCLSTGYSNSTAESAVTASKFIEANKIELISKLPLNKRSSRKSATDVKFSRLAESERSAVTRNVRRKTIK